MPNPIANWEGINNLDGVLPPDPTGAVGPNHYVQWVNLHMAIWDKSGTLVWGPNPGNTLWSGFGGPCDSCNDGDPVVLYDRLASRWVISQFALPNYPDGPFYQYVAVSQTSDPTGSWNRYVFTWPNNKMNDYPKLGVWPDGYYMTANQFASSTGAWAGAGVAALDRAHMLLGQSATIQYVDLYSVNAGFGGMLPCDVDGPAPPAGAPAYFGEVDDSSWIAPDDAFRIWQFHVDWDTPTSTTFGLAGQPDQILNVTGFTPLCMATRNCIPQPGTPRGLDAIGDRLMFRLQYRNFGSYQTLVTNHTVDAGSGVAGVRWYELRNSGSGWSIYQQGTYAPDSDSRWMGSAAMNASGTIALGYSVSSSSTYPSIRYAGRLSTDPLGVLSQGETTLIAGSGSQTSTLYRWGDYSTLSLDPGDDCTFWYTNEYLTTTGTAPWRTRIGSFQVTCCVTPGVPTIGTATVPGDNQITVSWTAGVPAGETYNVYRATLPSSSADCTTGTYTLLASDIAAPSYTDGTVRGTVTYGYRVSAVDSTGGCESAQSECVKATATGSCTTAPTFAGLTSVTNPASATCTLDLAWSAAVPNCGGAIYYNIYRSTSPSFVPDPTPGTGNRIATGVVATSYSDSAGLVSDTPYYYIVRAVDTGNGVEDSNSVIRSGAPTGPGSGTQTLFSQDFETGTGTNGWEIGTFNGGSSADWRGIQTCAAHGGTHIYRFGGANNCTANYANNDYCFAAPGGTVGIAVPAGANTVRLTFWHKWQFESGYDGALLYISTNNTNFTYIPASAFLVGSYTGAIGTTAAWSGTSTGYDTAFQEVVVDLDAAANAITGNTGGAAGKTLWIAFTGYSDFITVRDGWFLDDVSITAQIAGTCTTCVFSPTFVSADPTPATPNVAASQTVTVSNPAGSAVPSAFAFTWDTAFTVHAFGMDPDGILGFWQVMAPYTGSFVPTASYQVIRRDASNAFVDMDGNGIYQSGTDYDVSLSGRTITVSRTVAPGTVESQITGYRLILQDSLFTNPPDQGSYAVQAALTASCGNWSASLNEVMDASPAGCAPTTAVANTLMVTKSGTQMTLAWEAPSPVDVCMTGYAVFASTDPTAWSHFAPITGQDLDMDTSNTQFTTGDGLNLTFYLVAEVGGGGQLGPLGHYGM
jgi:hypothetical protein